VCSGSPCAARSRAHSSAATGEDDGPLAGATLADVSGERYGHATHARHTDISLALSHAIGSTQINAAGFTSTKRADDIDPTLPGDILAGVGAGNATTNTSAFEYIIATQTHGRDAYHLLDSRFAGGNADDAPNAAVAGVPAGYAAGYRYSGSYDEFALTRAFAASSLTLKTTLTQTATTGYVSTAGFAIQTPSRTGQSTLGVDYEHTARAHGYGMQVDAAHRFGAFPGTDLEARAHVKTTLAGTAVQLSATHTQAQLQEAYSAGAYDFSAPATASITCAGPSATIIGAAGALGRHPQADTLGVHAQRRLGQNANVSAGGFISVSRDGLVFPASQLGATLDPAYRAQVAADVALLCPGHALGADGLFVQRYESVPRLVGREWFITCSLIVGPFTRSGWSDMNGIASGARECTRRTPFEATAARRASSSIRFWLCGG
jgi:hypothetical protein